jgi:hypothetical protein
MIKCEPNDKLENSINSNIQSKGARAHYLRRMTKSGITEASGVS